MSVAVEQYTAENHIGGRSAGSITGQRGENVSPVTGQVLGSYPLSSSEDVDAAVAAARLAQPGWAAMSVFERVEALTRVYEIIASRREPLATLLTLEQGKVYATEALSEVDEMLAGFTVSLEAAKALEGAMPA